MDYFADIHSHSSLRAFSADKDIWYGDKVRDRKRDKTIVNFSQSEFSALARGNIRLVFLPLYPIEQGFISDLLKEMVKAPGIVDDVANPLIYQVVNNASLLKKALAKYVMNLKTKKFDEIYHEKHEYYEYLKEQYIYIRDNMNKLSDRIGEDKQKYNYVIIENYNHLKNVLGVDSEYNLNPQGHTIAIVLTIEGGHSLGSGQKNTVNLGLDKLNDVAEQNGQVVFRDKGVENLYKKLEKNILDLKNWEHGKHTPFFITLSHHFWNQLAGHSMSLAGLMHNLFNQVPGMNLPVTKLGEQVIDLLLSKDNGRRILIDSKHMTTDARNWYYEKIADHNNQHPDELIPLISSHSAVNGLKSIADSKNPPTHDEGDDLYEESEYFNNWDINLSDQEIRIIHQSGGLIGLNLDQRILSGKKMLNFISKYEKPENRTLYRSVWAEPLVQNIIHVLKVVYTSDIPNKDYVLHMMSIGSDFDGMINPIDAFCYAEDFKYLRKMLIQKLELKKIAYPFLQDKNITALVDGIMSKNAIRFLEKHFK